MKEEKDDTYFEVDEGLLRLSSATNAWHRDGKHFVWQASLVECHCMLAPGT
jgi:hypothetical protein